MYPENPEGIQVIVGSMNMGYVSETARNRTHNLFRLKPAPIPLGHNVHTNKCGIQIRPIQKHRPFLPTVFRRNGGDDEHFMNWIIDRKWCKQSEQINRVRG